MLAKFISYESNCKIVGKKGNSNQKLNNDKRWYECKKHHMWKRLYLESCSCSCKFGKYLASITDDSVITCDEIIEETKTVSTNFNEKRQPVEHKIYIFYLPFY